MNPQGPTTDQWDQISHALIFLFLFTGLGLTSAMGFLFGHAIVPSLVDSRDMLRPLSVLRWLAYPLALLALALAVYALGRALALATGVAQAIYPRTWI
jgi:hypothetical protein